MERICQKSLYLSDNNWSLLYEKSLFKSSIIVIFKLYLKKRKRNEEIESVLRNFFDNIIDLRTSPGDIWLVWTMAEDLPVKKIKMLFRGGGGIRRSPSEDQVRSLGFC